MRNVSVSVDLINGVMKDMSFHCNEKIIIWQNDDVTSHLIETVSTVVHNRLLQRHIHVPLEHTDHHQMHRRPKLNQQI